MANQNNNRQERKQVLRDGAVRQQDDVINVGELLRELIKSWKLILLVLIVGAALMAFYYKSTVYPVYQGTGTILLQSSEGSGSSLTNMLSDYPKIIASNEVFKRVVEELNLDMDYRVLSGYVSVSSADDSYIFSVTVTSLDSNLCVEIANSVINNSIAYISELNSNVDGVVMEYVNPGGVYNVSSSMISYVVKGAFFGFVLICACLVLRFLLDSSIKDEDDIYKYLNLPLLAEVPYYDRKRFGSLKKKNKKRR